MNELRRILIKFFILLLPFLVYYIGYNYYIIATRKYKSDNAIIYNAIYKSNQKVNKKKIIFGDSVGYQLYPNDIDYKSMDLFSLTTTAPSTIIGVYIMIQNLLKNNDLSGKEIFYIIHPDNLDEELSNKCTFNHFLKPFYICKNKKYFTEKAITSIKKIPYYWASQIPFIKNSNWQPEFEYKNDYSLKISDIYLEYFKLIKTLAYKYKFSFKVIMPLIKKEYININYDSIFKKQILENKLEDIFKGYFNNIRYIDNSEFRKDGSNHYLNPEKFGLNPLCI